MDDATLLSQLHSFADHRPPIGEIVPALAIHQLSRDVLKMRDGLREAKGTTIVTIASRMAQTTIYSFEQAFDVLVRATDMWEQAQADKARVHELEQQRDSVIEIHYEINTDADGTRCHECWKPWPCATALNLSLS